MPEMPAEGHSSEETLNQALEVCYVANRKRNLFLYKEFASADSDASECIERLSECGDGVSEAGSDDFRTVNNQAEIGAL